MKRLDSILEAASAHPWYHGQRPSDRLADWPVLNKNDLYQRLTQARGDQHAGRGIYYSRSGGTTSVRPFFFPTDIVENHRQRQRLARRLRDDGILSPATIAVNICPIVRMYRAMEIFNEFCELCGATVLPMAAIAEDDEIHEQAMLFGANTLIGMPSRLVAFARYLQETGRQWQVDTVLFGGEFLQPGKRRLLQEVLGVRRFSGVYGSAELGIVAWNAEMPATPVYHFPKDILHVEIEQADADGFGALVATNLLRRRFPIVRYRTGDVGRIVGEDAARVTIELRGRQSDSFLIGDNYHALGDFQAVLERFAEFQIQIRYDENLRKDVIRFCLVGSHQPLDEAMKAKIERGIRDTLQCHEKMYGTEIAICGPEDLQRSAGGIKTPAIIDRRGR